MEYSTSQIQFSIDRSKVNTDVFSYYHAWLKYKNKIISNSEPWIPVGRVGPCLILAHYVNTPEESIIDDGFFEKIIIQEEDYGIILKQFLEYQASEDHYHTPIKINTPDDHSTYLKAGLNKIYGNCPIEKKVAEEIWIQLNTDCDLNKLPKCYLTACMHLESHLGFLDLSVLNLNPELNQLLPIALLEHYQCIIVGGNTVDVWIGVSKPPSIELEDLLLSKLSPRFKKITFKICSESSILELIDAFKNKVRPITTYSNVNNENNFHGKNSIDQNECILLDEFKCTTLNPLDATVSSEETFQWILFQAYIRKASDIHVEQTSATGKIRIRIDGSLQLLLELSLEKTKSLVLVCKNACKMKPNDFDNQDAAFAFKCGVNHVNVRVNAMPFRKSFQKLSLRLFVQENNKITVSSLNIPSYQTELIHQCLVKSQGLILVSGPTGEGKTTTLYALLEELNTANRNIQTIEDPIERQIDGINQTSVDIARGVTFASVMKSIVRQDPDVILLGEIRDKETAELAIESSLTGHLVLTTIHANSSIKALARLYQLGIDPHLLANSVLILQAQRLLRKLCNKCKIPVSGEGSYFKPTGCNWCNHTGFKGRIPIMEFFPVCEEVQTAIASTATTMQLKCIFERKGYRSLYMEAIERAKEGIVCPFEANMYQENWIA